MNNNESIKYSNIVMLWLTCKIITIRRGNTRSNVYNLLEGRRALFTEGCYGTDLNIEMLTY